MKVAYLWNNLIIRTHNFPPHFYCEKFPIHLQVKEIVHKCSKSLHLDQTVVNILPDLLFISSSLLVNHFRVSCRKATNVGTQHLFPEQKVVWCNYNKMIISSKTNTSSIIPSNINPYPKFPTCPKDPINSYSGTAYLFSSYWICTLSFCSIILL